MVVYESLVAHVRSRNIEEQAEQTCERLFLCMVYLNWSTNYKVFHVVKIHSSESYDGFSRILLMYD